MKKSLASVACLVSSLVLGCPPRRESPFVCYGADRHASIRVTLVDDARAPTVYAEPINASFSMPVDRGTCGGLDGLGAGVTVDLQSIAVSDTGNFHYWEGCYANGADASFAGLGVVATVRNDDLFYASSYAVSNFPPLLQSVSEVGMFGGCQGRWMLIVTPAAIQWLPTPAAGFSSADFTDARLFDALQPGGSAPVVIQRVFELAPGTGCSAIADPTARLCSDTYYGYLTPVGP